MPHVHLNIPCDPGAEAEGLVHLPAALALVRKVALDGYGGFEIDWQCAGLSVTGYRDDEVEFGVVDVFFEVVGGETLEQMLAAPT